MTRKEYVDYCQRCINKKIDRKKGLVCSLTNNIASFDENCKDFKRDENFEEPISYTEKSANLTPYLLLAFFVILVIAVTVYYLSEPSKTSSVYLANQEKEIQFFDKFSEQDCINFAIELEQSILNQDSILLNKSVDYDYLIDYMLLNKKMSKQSRKNLKKILKPNFNPGGNLVNQAIYGDFSFRKYYQKNGIPHIVFRSFAQEEISILDFELGILRNQIGIKNAYNYYFGETWGDLYYRRMNTVNKYNERHYELKNVMMNINKMKELVLTEKFIEADSIYQELNDDFKEFSEVRFLASSIAQGLGTQKYNNFINSFLSTRQRDPKNNSLLRLLKYYYNKDYSNTLLAVKELNKYTNNDEIFNFYLAKACLDSSSIDKAQFHTSELKKHFPKLFDGYTLQLDIYMITKEFDLAINTLSDMVLLFNISIDDIHYQMQKYPGFQNSTVYKQFLKDFN